MRVVISIPEVNCSNPSQKKAVNDTVPTARPFLELISQVFYSLSSKEKKKEKEKKKKRE